MAREWLRRIGKRGISLYQTRDGYQIGRMVSDNAWSVYEKDSDPTDAETVVWFGSAYRFATLTEALERLRKKHPSRPPREEATDG